MKKESLVKILVGVVATAGTVAGGLFLGKKFKKNKEEVSEEVKETTEK